MSDHDQITILERINDIWLNVTDMTTAAPSYHFASISTVVLLARQPVFGIYVTEQVNPFIGTYMYKKASHYMNVLKCWIVDKTAFLLHAIEFIYTYRYVYLRL